MDANPKRRHLTRKLTAWAVGFDERRHFAHLVSRYRFGVEEQQAAADWIYLRAEMLTRQQHRELGSKPREAWSRVHERAFLAWSRALHGQIAQELAELQADVAVREEDMTRYAAHLGFRRHADLIDALGLDHPTDYAAANER